MTSQSSIGKQKKILIFAMLTGGVSTWVENVIGKLIPEYGVYLLSTAIPTEFKNNPILTHEKVVWQTAPLLSKKKLFGIGQVAKFIKTHRPDQLVCLDTFTVVCAVCARWLSFHKVPITIVVVGIYRDFSPRQALKTKLVLSIIGFLLDSKKDKVVSVSPAVSEYIKTTPLKHLDTVMIPNGLESAPVEVEPIVQDPQYQHIVFLGRLDIEKGPDRFLDVAKMLADKPLKFHVLSDGSMKDELKAQVQRDGLENAVIFHGWIEDVLPFLKGMDALLITSRTEGLPFSALEAFRCELPVISLNVGGMSYLLQNGNNGILCETLEEMASVVEKNVFSDKEDLKSKAKNASSFLEKELSLSKMVDKYKQLW